MIILIAKMSKMLTKIMYIQNQHNSRYNAMCKPSKSHSSVACPLIPKHACVRDKSWNIFSKYTVVFLWVGSRLGLILFTAVQLRSVVPKAGISGRDKLLHSTISVGCNYFYHDTYFRHNISELWDMIIWRNIRVLRPPKNFVLASTTSSRF